MRRLADARLRARACVQVLRAFCYKQLVHVSIVGGGVFTASSPLLTQSLGPFGLAAVSGGGLLGTNSCSAAAASRSLFAPASSPLPPQNPTSGSCGCWRCWPSTGRPGNTPPPADTPPSALQTLLCINKLCVLCPPYPLMQPRAKSSREHAQVAPADPPPVLTGRDHRERCLKQNLAPCFFVVINPKLNRHKNRNGLARSDIILPCRPAAPAFRLLPHARCASPPPVTPRRPPSPPRPPRLPAGG